MPKLSKKQQKRLATDMVSKAFKLYEYDLLSLVDLEKIRVISNKVMKKL